MPNIPNKIITLETNIFKLYKELMILEQKNKKYSEDYEDSMSLLNIAIKLEDKMLKEVNTKIFDIIKSELETNKKYNLKFEKDELIDENLVYIRIFNKLVKLRVKKNASEIQNEYDYINNIDLRINEQLNIYRLNEFNKFIRKEDNQKIKNKIIVNKYEDLFTTGLIEPIKEKDKLIELLIEGYDKENTRNRIIHAENNCINNTINELLLLTDDKVKDNINLRRDLILLCQEIKIHLILGSKDDVNEIYWGLYDKLFSKIKGYKITKNTSSKVALTSLQKTLNEVYTAKNKVRNK